MMKTLSQITFLEWLLLFLLINLALLYWYQRNGCLAACFGGKCPPTSVVPVSDDNSRNREGFKCGSCSLSSSVEPFDAGQVMIPEMQNQRRLLDNMNRGLKVGFHQHFRPYLPELGWRRLYERMNNTVSAVGNLHDPLIKGVNTRHYLDVMEGVDNVYKYTNY